MVEQVWKNIVGNRLPYEMKGNNIVVTVPRGSNITVNQFFDFIARMEQALDKTHEIKSTFTDEDLVQYAISFKNKKKSIVSDEATEEDPEENSEGR